MSEIEFEAWKLGWLSGRVAELAKVAAKIGVEPMTLTVVERFVKPTTDELLGITGEETWVRVVLEGEMPKLPGGWVFLGAIEHAAVGNLVHGDDPALESYRDAEPNCDHCGMRRNRKKTVVVRNESGEVAQIGSACMKDFLGYHGNPEKVLWLTVELSDSLDDLDRCGGSSWASYGTSTAAFLLRSVASVRQYGWVPKSYDPSTATATVAMQSLGFGARLRRPEDNRLLDLIEGLKPVQEDAAKVSEIRSWFSRNEFNDTYHRNLKTVVASDEVEPKHFGLLASAVSAYDKAMGREIEKKAQEEMPKVPVVPGSGVPVEGSVVSTKLVDSDYGSTLKMLLQCEGYRLWGSVPKTLAGVEVGDRVRLVANVETSRDDEFFGFFSRPRKGEWVDGKTATEVPCGDAIRHANWDCECPVESDLEMVEVEA